MVLAIKKKCVKVEIVWEAVEKEKKNANGNDSSYFGIVAKHVNLD